MRQRWKSRCRRIVVIFCLLIPGEPGSMTFRRAPGRPGPDEPSAPSVIVNVRIPTDILKALDALAAQRGMPRHQAIREALARYVEAEVEKPNGVPLVSQKTKGPVSGQGQE